MLEPHPTLSGLTATRSLKQGISPIRMAFMPWISGQGTTSPPFGLSTESMVLRLSRGCSKRGAARCICTVSAPISTFRQTLVSETEAQTISWDIDELGEPPLFTADDRQHAGTGVGDRREARRRA